ncbi:uncharacterized protein LOC114738478 [Neltuma alba]|uniref:uncharacterized protein LOC114738478 n=1 Tax=Neltuma alba TaxID=207710 RepID=UPI0010A386F9|nr:uncharacterized protein LOC114738478 [Prosopis alba]
MVYQRDDFWVRIIRDKYKYRVDMLPVMESRRPGSNTWIGIKKTWKEVKEGLEGNPHSDDVRNLRIFEGNIVLANMIVAQSKAMVSSVKVAHCKLRGTHRTIEARKEKWKPPDPDWIKVNVDGAYTHHSQSMACGGVARDDKGTFLVGFTCRMEGEDCLLAEL